MKQSITLAVCLAFASPLLAQSASEKVAKRLVDLLTPGSNVSPIGAAKPLAWKAGKSVDAIELPIMPYAGTPARLPQAPAKDAKPRALPEGPPLIAYQDRTPLPQAVELPTTPLIRLPAIDLHAPLAIPILAQASKDRASLAEPAFEASVDAAMRRFAPVRDKPVPFTPLNLPDPFEHVRYGELRNPPSESATPPVMPLTKPK